MNRNGFVLLSLVLVFVFALSACQPAAAPAEQAPAAEASEAPAEAAVQKGGTLNLVESAIVQFDPPFINDDASFHVASLVHVFLFRVSQDAEGNETTIPELASSWDMEEDGKVIIFHLNKGWTFHDGNDIFAEGKGREITAEDVVYSIERMVNIEGSSISVDLLNSFESVEAVDAYTVKLTLTQPDAILFSSGRGLSSGAILPKEAVEARGETWGLNPIGGGPFEFVEYVADDHVTLRKNEDYIYEPNLDSVVFKIIPDDATQLISLEAGDIDHMYLPPAEFARFENDPNYQIYPGNCPYSFHIQFDQKNPLLQDVKVREAIARAIDGTAIMRNEFGGMYVEGCGIAGPGVAGYDPTLCELFTFDTAKTDQLMTEAGWAKNASGIWAKDGVPLALDFEVWNLTPAPSLATAATTQLEQAGFDINMMEVEFGTWIQDAMGADTQKPLMMWSGFCGEGGLNSFYGSTGLAPAWGFDNQEVFDLLDSANTIVDKDERQNTLQSATRKIYEDYSDIPMGFAVGYEITNKAVNDWSITMWWLKVVTSVNNVWLSR